MTLLFGVFVRKPCPTDWTPEQVAALHRMAGKASVAEIAAATGRSVEAIKHKARSWSISLARQHKETLERGQRGQRGRRGVRQDDWQPAEVDTLCQMAQTHNSSEIARLLGRTPKAVRHKAAKMGVSLAKYGELHETAKYPTAAIERIHQLKAQGWTCASIARETGMSPANVSSIIRYRVRWRESMALGVIPENTEMPWHGPQKWATATYCSVSCAVRAKPRPRPPNTLCDCGNVATHAPLIVQFAADGRNLTERMPLCDDCHQLFEEQESAARIWGCVRPEPHARRWASKEFPHA